VEEVIMREAMGPLGIALVAAATAAGIAATATGVVLGTRARRNVRANVATDFNPAPRAPEVAATAFIDDDAEVIGSVALGEHVFVGPHAFLRGDEGQSIRIGDDSNVQDCAGVHALETVEREGGEWRRLAGRAYRADGARATDATPEADAFAVWVGSRVSIAHQALVHGPAWIGDDTFVGMQAQVFNAKIGRRCVVAPRALVMGVEVADERLVPPGAVITTQEAADALGSVRGTAFEKLNGAVVHVNTSLADGYRKGR
jgi:carbonic anhydrase/acetyltransferase-like protein (isoleucine patch superfamily)